MKSIRCCMLKNMSYHCMLVLYHILPFPPPSPFCLIPFPLLPFSVIVSDKKVYAFGQNDRGQLGLGNHTPTDVPTLVSGLEEFVPRKITCGRFHTALHTGTQTTLLCCQ